MNLRVAIFSLLFSACVSLGCNTTSGQLNGLPEKPTLIATQQLEKIVETQKRMQRDIEEIKMILQRLTGQGPSLPTDLTLNLDGAPVKGSKDAKLILLEFSDYQCPFCSRHFRDTLPRIENEYIKTRKLNYVFWDFPLESQHKEAFKAHEAAHCAGEQQKYWEMHDRIFQNQDTLGASELPKHAQALGLNLAQFENCLANERHAARVRAAIADAQRVGISGTPTFLLVTRSATHQGNKVLSVIQGAQPFARFKDVIDKALAEEVN